MAGGNEKRPEGPGCHEEASRNTLVGWSLSELVRDAPIGIAIVGTDLRYQFVNERLAQLNGVSVDDHTGQKIAVVSPHATVIVPLLRKVLETGEAIVDHELELDVTDSEGAPGRRHVVVNYRPMPSGDAPMSVGVVVLDVTDLVNARNQQSALATRLRTLQRITDAALEQLPLDHLIDELLPQVREALRVDIVRLLIVDEGAGVLRGRGLLRDRKLHHFDDEVPLGKGFAGRVATSRSPKVVEDTRSYDLVSAAVDGMRSIAGVPLIARGKVVGVLDVATRTPTSFSPEDLQLLDLAGRRIAMAVQRSQSYEQERHVAAVLQGALLPRDLPAIPGCRLAVSYWPSSDEEAVGGDFYDVFETSRGTWGVLVGDISGKGIEAAALTGLARHSVRAAGQHVRDPVTTLRWLDDALRADPCENFCTAVYGEITSCAGGVRVELARAGHPAPVVVHRDGSAEFVGSPGTLLGLVPELDLCSHRIALDVGDSLVLYTDGLSDVAGDQPDDLELLERISGWIDHGVDGLLEHVDDHLNARPQGRADDAVVLAIEVTGTGDAADS